MVDSFESGLWMELTISLGSSSFSIQNAASAVSSSNVGILSQDVIVFIAI